MLITKTTSEDIPDMLKLIKNYYEFYELKCPKEKNMIELIKKYVDDISVGIQFIARIDGVAVGFATVDVSYSAVRMGELLVLSELHVDPDYEGQDVGKSIFRKCQEYTMNKKYMDLLWLTNTEKYALQVLYDRFEKETEFYSGK